MTEREKIMTGQRDLHEAMVFTDSRIGVNIGLTQKGIEPRQMLLCVIGIEIGGQDKTENRILELVHFITTQQLTPDPVEIWSLRFKRSVQHFSGLMAMALYDLIQGDTYLANQILERSRQSGACSICPECSYCHPALVEAYLKLCNQMEQ